MLHLAICDDDSAMIEEIETYINRMKDRQIDYDFFHNTEDLLKYQRQNGIYDVYILDIEMKKINGLELAKILRSYSSNALIIFLTGYPQYVYDVFDVVTFDFIIKPITFEKFNNLITRIEDYLKITRKNFIFSYRKNNYCLPINNISFIEKMGRKAFIHDVNGNVYQCNMTLSEIWHQLDEKMFAPIHTSCIINLAEIIGIAGDEVLLKSHQKLFVSRNYKQKLKKQHLQFLKGLI